MDNNEKVYNTIKNILCNNNMMVDSVTTELIKQCITTAETKICNYENWKEYNDDYLQAKMTLAIAYYNVNMEMLKESANNPVVSSYTEGSRSETYKTLDNTFDGDGLTTAVKAMLPTPKLRVY